MSASRLTPSDASSTQKTRQPVGVQPVRRLRHEGDAREVGEGVAVREGHLAAPRDPLVEHLELPPPDAREHVGQAVVVAHVGVLVGDARVARLLRPEAGLLTHAGSCATSIPPPVVVMILLPLKLYAPMGARVPAGRPLYVLPTASAASSTTAMP
jgi:hypothetical protein